MRTVITILAICVIAWGQSMPLGTYTPNVYFADLVSNVADGSVAYCIDCKNVTDDVTGTFDSVASSGGHGTTVLHENGVWRVH